MRIFAFFGLAVFINLLVLGSGAQAQEKSPPPRAALTSAKVQTIADPGGQPPTVDISGTPDPLEFFFFFRHLASLDAAADQAVAQGNPDAIEWKSLHQREAGLTDEQGAIVKEVAYACNQTLSDAQTQEEGSLSVGGPAIPVDPPPSRMEIVGAAVDELHSRLGEEAFQALAAHVHANFGSELEVVSNPPGPVPPDVTEDPDLPVEANLILGEINVSANITKLSGNQLFATCDTAMDTTTAQNYPATLTYCTVYGDDGSQRNVTCNTSLQGQCTEILGGFPGTLYQTAGAHNLYLYPGTCEGGSPGLLDPMHYCTTQQLPTYRTGTRILAQGDSVCWAPAPIAACGLARTESWLIGFVGLSPIDVTLVAGQQQRFVPNIAAFLRLIGPGRLEGNLYTAPATIDTPQTATIVACDANPNFSTDCSTSTIHLQPLKVEITPADSEVLPGGTLEFSAQLTPSIPEQTVTWTWSLSTRPGDPVGTFTPGADDSSKGTYQAPADNPVQVVEDVIVKACAKPQGSNESVCGTAKVFVKPILFYILGAKNVLTLDETTQVTAFVQNTNVPLEITWSSPQDGLLEPWNPLDPDPFVRIYYAPPYPVEAGGVDLEACLKDSPDFCAKYHIKLPVPLSLDDIISDTGKWQAGTTTGFTIIGQGWGPPPPVAALLPMATTVTSFSETTIRGSVVLSAGSATVEPTVAVTYPNGAEFLVSLTVNLEPTTLSVAPSTAQLTAGGEQQFGAFCLTSTAGPCTSNEIPSWSASLGRFSAQAGLSVTYTAPASVPSNTTDTIRACWPSGACAVAQVTLTPPAGVAVSVSPKTALVKVGQTQPFNAQVTGTTNTAVTWSIQPPTPEAGSISQSGLYAAPAVLGSVTTVTVIATSQADGTKSDTATVTLFSPPTISVTPSPAPANTGTPITWTVTVSGGSPATYQYALFRRRAGTSIWTPDQAAPAWQASNVFSWTPAFADTGTWEILIWVKDNSTPPNIYPINPGNVQIIAPLTSLTCTPSPAAALHGNAITWTATANGGVPASLQYALFRRRAGVTTWTPDVTAPDWKPSNTPSWTPTSADIGNWEIILWVKDGTTPANQNTYGYAAYCNPGPVRVVGPLSLTSTPSPASVYSGTTITWTATASGGDAPTIQYAFGRRRVGATDWIPATAVWQTGNVFNWTPAATDTGAWEIAIVVRDATTPANANGYGYAAYTNPGNVQVVPPLALTGTPSPATSSQGNAITWTLTASGGTGVNRQYAFFRRRAGTTPWTPDVTAAAWQASNVFTWNPGSTDTGNWEIIFWAKDSATPATMNTYGFAAYFNAGPVQVLPPLTVTGTGSPAASIYGNAITWTATTTGGDPASTRYALFRRRSGTTPWTPDVSAPNWQTSNVLSWTPGSADVGTWDIIIWAKDGNTPPTMNTYGYASYYNPGPVRVVAPLGLTITPSPASAYSGTTLTWTATASGGDAPTIQYAFGRRRVGAADWIPSTTVWQTSNVFSWTPAPTDTGAWEIAAVVRDVTTPPNANGSGYAAYANPGNVQVVTPLTVTGPASPAWSLSGNAITWTVSASGGTGTGRQYALFRRRSGTTTWTPSVNSPAWQTSNVLSWTPVAADAGNWDVYVWVKDSATPANMNTYGYAAGYNPGGVQVVAPMTVSGTGSPASAYSGTSITWTANASGNTPSTTRYALFRRRAGTTPWTPDVTAPAWQASNVLSWTPASTDTGTWEIIIWVKDGNTPANMNTYGYAAYYNAQPVQVVTPPSLSVSGSPGSAIPYGTTLTWTANASGGTGTSVRYAFFRRRSGTSTWTPDVNSPAWQTSNTYSWATTSADEGNWDTYVWMKDSATPSTMNTYGYAAGYNTGGIQIVTPAPLTVSGTGSPSTSPVGTALSWTANTSGGVPSTVKYALFRQKAGTSNWIPDVTAPSWQSSNVLHWTPSPADVGTWSIIIWVKDVNTPPTQNGYGFAAYYNAQPVQVVP